VSGGWQGGGECAPYCSCDGPDFACTPLLEGVGAASPCEEICGGHCKYVCYAGWGWVKSGDYCNHVHPDCGCADSSTCGPCDTAHDLDVCLPDCEV
jgi:hypothetical protein